MKNQAISRHIKEIMHERTLVLIKPDGVMRSLVGRILQRFEDVGLKIIGVKFKVPTDDELSMHFPKSQEWVIGMGLRTIEMLESGNIDPVELLGTRNATAIGEQIRAWSYHYLKLGPVLIVAFEGPHAIQQVRKIVGHTLPCNATPGTIRGDFSSNCADLASFVGAACKNVIHASSNKEEAEQEIACWFQPEELVCWKRPDENIMFL